MSLGGRRPRRISRGSWPACVVVYGASSTISSGGSAREARWGANVRPKESFARALTQPRRGGSPPRATNENGVAVRAAARVKCEDGDNCPGLTSEVPPARCFLSSRPDPGRGQRRCGGGTLPSGCVFYSVGFSCRQVVTRERAHSFFQRKQIAVRGRAFRGYTDLI